MFNNGSQRHLVSFDFQSQRKPRQNSMKPCKSKQVAQGSRHSPHLRSFPTLSQLTQLCDMGLRMLPARLLEGYCKGSMSNVMVRAVSTPTQEAVNSSYLSSLDPRSNCLDKQKG